MGVGGTYGMWLGEGVACGSRGCGMWVGGVWHVGGRGVACGG